MEARKSGGPRLRANLGFVEGEGPDWERRFHGPRSFISRRLLGGVKPRLAFLETGLRAVPRSAQLPPLPAVVLAGRTPSFGSEECPSPDLDLPRSDSLPAPCSLLLGFSPATVLVPLFPSKTRSCKGDNGFCLWKSRSAAEADLSRCIALS